MTKKHTVQTLDIVSKQLQKLNSAHTSWRSIALLPEYRKPSGEPIPPGTLCSIAKGRDPKDPEVRLVLGLPALLPAPACAKCGAVHVTKRCMRRRDNEYEMASDLAEMGM